METFEAIFNRRSIRKYSDKPISEDIRTELLKAAMYAPSARNYRSWQFIVIDDRKMLDDLSALHPYAKMLKQAPLAILVCGDKSIEPEEGYNAVNCSAATQNILLAAHAMGLGSVWLGVYPREARMKDIAAYLKLPAHIMPINLIALGYPDEVKTKPERFEEEKVHLNGW